MFVPLVSKCSNEGHGGEKERLCVYIHTIELGDQVCQVQGFDQGEVAAGVRGEEVLLLVVC